MSGPASHRVDVTEEEREHGSNSQEKRDPRNGSNGFPQFQHPFCPPGGYWSPYMYMAQPMPHYPHSTAVALPESQPHNAQHGATSYYPPGHVPPQYLAVNVHTDNHQHQTQKQSASSKQLTIKEKVIKNVTRGLDQLLDVRILSAGLAAFLLPKVAHHLQHNKRRRRGLFLEFGLA